MSDLLREQLSALMDGELPHEECELLVKRISNSADLARSWHAYHLIGDALRDQLAGSDAEQLAPRVREALTEEAGRTSRPHGAGRLRRWSTLAAAVAVLGLAGLAGSLITRHMDSGKVFAPAGANSTNVSSPVHVDWRSEPQPVQAELSRYLMMHDPYGMTPNASGDTPSGAATAMPPLNKAANERQSTNPPY